MKILYYLLINLIFLIGLNNLVYAVHTTQRLSIGIEESNGDSFATPTAVSANGRWTVFTSDAFNLVANDLNTTFDVFLKDNWLGEIRRLSVNADGIEGNASSSMASISADGRYIAFSSHASNLAPTDPDKNADIFLVDRLTNTLSHVTQTIDGTPSNGDDFNPVLSADGRYLAFQSSSSNLITGDNNTAVDIFSYDRTTQTIQRISVGNGGEEANGNSTYPSISADGQQISFASLANNLVANDANNASDIFLHNRQTQQTQLISQAINGLPANQGSFRPAISGNGQLVVFESLADDLVTADANGMMDIFLRDVNQTQTQRLTFNANGEESNRPAFFPNISANGQVVTFESNASNLLPNKTNGGLNIFHLHRRGQQLQQANLATDDQLGNFAPFAVGTALSQDGCSTVFSSPATNLVAGDNNNHFDIFIHTKTVAARYELQNGRLTIPAIALPNQDVYQATLQWLGEFLFTLNGGTLITEDKNSCHHVSQDATLLHLPLVDIVGEQGEVVGRYAVTFRTLPNTNPLQFELIYSIAY